MIHAYDEYYLSDVQEKTAIIFEIAVMEENINIIEFMNIFLKSDITHFIEEANPIYIHGKSAAELYALIMNKEPKTYVLSSDASPSYWAGYVLAYAQWYFNTTFKAINDAIDIKTILDNYFPYHEMDIRQTMDLIGKYFIKENNLRKYREKSGYSQSELSILSNVPIRNIRAYEQGKIDIAKAEAETLYKLSRVLRCSIEDLIK